MNIAVILAGGIGQRIGVNIPKQFLEIEGTPIIIRTLKAFERHKEIDIILVVCLEDWHNSLHELVKEYNLKKVRYIIKQGKTRRESSLNAIVKLQEFCNDDDIILIHDAARPNVSEKVISDNIQAAKKEGACETVVPAHDTIVISKDGLYSNNIPPRNELFVVQTPQTFQYSLIRYAHQHYAEQLTRGVNVPDITDDAGLILYANKKVYLVKGDKLNIKVTSPDDLLLLKAIISPYKDQ